MDKGRPEKAWFFTYEDLAKLTGRATNSIHQAASRGTRRKASGFDPGSFESVVLWVFRNATDEFRMKLLGEMKFFRDSQSAIRRARSARRQSLA